MPVRTQTGKIATPEIELAHTAACFGKRIPGQAHLPWAPIKQNLKPQILTKGPYAETISPEPKTLNPKTRAVDPKP